MNLDQLIEKLQQIKEEYGINLPIEIMQEGELSGWDFLKDGFELKYMGGIIDKKFQIQSAIEDIAVSKRHEEDNLNCAPSKIILIGKEND